MRNKKFKSLLFVGSFRSEGWFQTAGADEHGRYVVFTIRRRGSILFIFRRGGRRGGGFLLRSAFIFIRAREFLQLRNCFKSSVYYGVMQSDMCVCVCVSVGLASDFTRKGDVRTMTENEHCFPSLVGFIARQ